MVELLLGAVIAALLLYMAWERYETRREHSKLINALISKTPEQLRDLEFVERVKIPEIKQEQSDLIPVEQLSDEEFAEKVGLQNG